MAAAENGIKVFLLAENRLLREALTRILGKKQDIDVVGAAPFSTSAVEQIALSAPDVLLLDSFPHPLSNLGFIRETHQGMSEPKVVMIGMDPDEGIFLRAVREGVVGYVLKDASAMEVAAAVRAVAKNEAVCPPSLCMGLFQYVARQATEVPNFQLKEQLGLTRREQQLIQMIGRGLTNKEIAKQLNLAEQTIKNHIHRMLRKLGASDRLAVVELCRTQGFAA